MYADLNWWCFYRTLHSDDFNGPIKSFFFSPEANDYWLMENKKEDHTERRRSVLDKQQDEVTFATHLSFGFFMLVAIF